MTADQEELRSRFEQLSSEELKSILRRHDRDVWRPEVFEIVRAILAGRGVFSLESMSPAAEAGNSDAVGSEVVTPPEGWQEIANGLDLGEADDSDKLLSAAAVPVQVIQDGPHSFSIHVPGEHAANAWHQLRKAGIQPSEDAPEAITLTGGSCPACGEIVPPEAGECPACGLAV